MQFFYTQTVYAGVPLQLPYGGSYFLLSSAGVARKVGIQMTSDGQTSKIMQDMTTGFSLPVKFDAITFYSPVDTVVAFFASPGPVTLGSQDGAAVNVPGGVRVTNAAGDPVHVTFSQQIVPLGEVFTQPHPLATFTHVEPVSVGLVATALISDATQKRLRFRNAHASAVVALGGAGVTLGNAAVQLQPGDVWIEDEAAGASWYAISDTAATPVQIMGLK